jgi:hypothetical protein
MTDERETMRDEELRRVLRKWEAPVVPDGMDDRVVAAYRREAGRAEPFWMRWFTSSIRVPVPVALVVALLLIFTAALALRPASPPPTAVAPGPAAPVRAARTASAQPGSSLAGFQAVTEITATVVQEGAP